LTAYKGSGMSRILKYYDKSAFEILPNFIKITFKFINTGTNVTANVTANQTMYKILEMITENKNVTIDEMANVISKNRKTVLREMKKLKDSNVIKRIWVST
jgi:predicted HTH transcriptional regulator